MTNILAIIPARGGSKGIPKKNLKKVFGTSLVNRAVECAKASKIITDIYVSTDSQEIIKEVGKIGLRVPFMRPDELSGDRVGDYEVLRHGLIEYEQYFKKKIDIIVMLQPTSPLRSPAIVDDCISMLDINKLDTVWSVSDVDLKYHPLKQIVKNNDGYANLFDEEGKNIIARQQLQKTFVRNGACYVFSRNCITEQNTIYGKKMELKVMHTPQISIDTIEDLERVEKILSRN
jgi:CMP-N,N'-diacetyllegionaminic acid synthase